MINNFPLINIYEKPKQYSKLSSQMLYGEKFKILEKKGYWLKIKTNYDNYTGYIRKKKFLIKEFVPTFKVSSKKTEIIYKRVEVPEPGLPTKPIYSPDLTLKDKSLNKGGS